MASCLMDYLGVPVKQINPIADSNESDIHPETEKAKSEVDDNDIQIIVTSWEDGKERFLSNCNSNRETLLFRPEDVSQEVLMQTTKLVSDTKTPKPTNTDLGQKMYPETSLITSETSQKFMPVLCDNKDTTRQINECEVLESCSTSHDNNKLSMDISLDEEKDTVNADSNIEVYMDVDDEPQFDSICENFENMESETSICANKTSAKKQTTELNKADGVLFKQHSFKFECTDKGRIKITETCSAPANIKYNDNETRLLTQSPLDRCEQKEGCTEKKKENKKRENKAILHKDRLSKETLKKEKFDIKKDINTECIEHKSLKQQTDGHKFHEQTCSKDNSANSKSTIVSNTDSGTNERLKIEQDPVPKDTVGKRTKASKGNENNPPYIQAVKNTSDSDIRKTGATQFVNKKQAHTATTQETEQTRISCSKSFKSKDCKSDINAKNTTNVTSSSKNFEHSSEHVGRKKEETEASKVAQPKQQSNSHSELSDELRKEYKKEKVIHGTPKSSIEKKSKSKSNRSSKKQEPKHASTEHYFKNTVKTGECSTSGGATAHVKIKDTDVDLNKKDNIESEKEVTAKTKSKNIDTKGKDIVDNKNSKDNDYRNNISAINERSNVYSATNKTCSIEDNITTMDRTSHETSKVVSPVNKLNSTVLKINSTSVEHKNRTFSINGKINETNAKNNDSSILYKGKTNDSHSSHIKRASTGKTKDSRNANRNNGDHKSVKCPGDHKNEKIIGTNNDDCPDNHKDIVTNSKTKKYMGDHKSTVTNGKIKTSSDDYKRKDIPLNRNDSIGDKKINDISSETEQYPDSYKNTGTVVPIDDYSSCRKTKGTPVKTKEFIDNETTFKLKEIPAKSKSKEVTCGTKDFSNDKKNKEAVLKVADEPTITESQSNRLQSDSKKHEERKHLDKQSLKRETHDRNHSAADLPTNTVSKNKTQRVRRRSESSSDKTKTTSEQETPKDCHQKQNVQDLSKFKIPMLKASDKSRTPNIKTQQEEVERSALLECNICRLVLCKDQIELDKHKLTFHTVDHRRIVYKCDLCNLCSFPDEEKLDKHKFFCRKIACSDESLPNKQTETAAATAETNEVPNNDTTMECITPKPEDRCKKAYKVPIKQTETAAAAAKTNEVPNNDTTMECITPKPDDKCKKAYKVPNKQTETAAATAEINEVPSNDTTMECITPKPVDKCKKAYKVLESNSNLEECGNMNRPSQNKPPCDAWNDESTETENGSNNIEKVNDSQETQMIRNLTWKQIRSPKRVMVCEMCCCPIFTNSAGMEDHKRKCSKVADGLIPQSNHTEKLGHKLDQTKDITAETVSSTSSVNNMESLHSALNTDLTVESSNEIKKTECKVHEKTVQSTTKEVTEETISTSLRQDDISALEDEAKTPNNKTKALTPIFKRRQVSKGEIINERVRKRRHDDTQYVPGEKRSRLMKTCNICYKEYYTKDDLLRHVFRVHKRKGSSSYPRQNYSTEPRRERCMRPGSQIRRRNDTLDRIQQQKESNDKCKSSSVQPSDKYRRDKPSRFSSDAEDFEAKDNHSRKEKDIKIRRENSHYSSRDRNMPTNKPASIKDTMSKEKCENLVSNEAEDNDFATDRNEKRLEKSNPDSSSDMDLESISCDSDINIRDVEMETPGMDNPVPQLKSNEDESHSAHTKWTCRKCGWFFGNEDDLQSHLRLRHSNSNSERRRSYTPFSSRRRFSGQRSSRSKMPPTFSSHRRNLNTTCRACFQTFDCWASLRTHIFSTGHNILAKKKAMYD